MHESAEFVIVCLGNHFGHGREIELDNDFQYDIEDLVQYLSINGGCSTEVKIGCHDLGYFTELMDALLHDSIDWRRVLMCFVLFVQTVAYMRLVGLTDTFGHQDATIKLFLKRHVTEWVRSRKAGWRELLQYMPNTSRSSSTES